MKKETKEELAEVFRDGWPIFLTNFLGGMAIGSMAVLLIHVLR